MRTAKTILTVIQERGKQHKPIERVYKLLFNREFYLNQVDAPREFVLKVVETICGGGFYHEEGARKSFNI